MSQSHGSSLWQEPAGSGGAPTPVEMILQRVAGTWQHVPGSRGDAQAVAVNLGDGAYTIVDLTAEWYIGADGTLTTVGPAAFVPVDDGTGTLVPTAIGSGIIPAARFFPDSRGDIYAVRLDADELEFVRVLGTVRAF